LRSIAGVVAAIWGALAVGAFFRHRVPEDSAWSVILFRLLFYGALSGVFIRRTFGPNRKFGGWMAAGALASISAWDAAGRMGAWGLAAFASVAVLSFGGHAIEKRRAEAGATAVTPDGASPRR
jgi:hypothetical protein